MTTDQKSLNDWQQCIQKMVAKQGWQKTNIFQLYFLFQEEIGELTQAIRAQEKYHLEKDSHKLNSNLEEELADVLMYLLDIANFYHIDLASALNRKIEKNSQREWKKK